MAAGQPAVTLGFTLTVNNGASSAASTVTVTVDALPIANAGPPQRVASNAVVTLNGAASTDPNTPVRPLTFRWTQTSGTAVTLANATSALASFTAPVVLPVGAPPAVLGFQLTVSDGLASATASVTVTVNAALAPVVTLTAPQTVAEGKTVTLDASGSVDPNTPPVGPTTFAWVQTGGTPVVVLTNANTAKPTFVSPTVPPGQTSNVLTFAVTVNNGAAAVTASTTVTVIVLPPIANAGPAQTIRSLTTVTLNGTASSDPNAPPRALTFHWTQVSGTVVTLATPNAATTTFTAPLVNGGNPPLTLVFTLTVSNGLFSSTSTVVITDQH
jgi:hypothetical protein